MGCLRSLGEQILHGVVHGCRSCLFHAGDGLLGRSCIEVDFYDDFAIGWNELFEPARGHASLF